MDIFLCLVSYQFLASDYIKTVELPRAMARHKNGEIEVVPVILYRMDLERDCKFLYELNPLPKGLCRVIVGQQGRCKKLAKRQSESASSWCPRFLLAVFCVGCFCARR